MNNQFTLIEAAGNARPKVAGLAYSGGKMNLPGWQHPVVVALDGLEIPPTVPLLTNHENRTDCRVGVVKATIQDGALAIEGEIISDSAGAQDIVAQCKAGAEWQLSIGADVQKSELVKAEREVNGQYHRPFYPWPNRFAQVSVVAVGADASTGQSTPSLICTFLKEKT